jgi:hydroxymethylglutaryl-CoA reductase
MSKEEFSAGARAAAWGDRTHRAEQTAQFDDDRAEVMAIWEENQEAMAEAKEELQRNTTG